MCAPKGWHGTQDTLVYPVVLVLQQYLEPELEHIEIRLRVLLDKEPEHHMGHGLTKLWDECTKLMREAKMDGTAEPAKAIKDYTTESYEVDPTAQAFMYPVDVEEILLLPGITRISILSFHERTQDIGQRLEEFDCQLQAEIDAKQDLYGIYGDHRGIKEP